MTQLHSFLRVRAVLVVDFPSQNPEGREQQGKRPAVVVALPNVTGTVRFLLILVVPLTAQQGDWAEQNQILYPCLQAGMGNIAYDSIVLLDQIRAIDIQRVYRYLGTLTPEEYQPIENGLKAMFGF